MRLRRTALRAYPGWTPPLGLPKGLEIKSRSQSQIKITSQIKSPSP
jgi:hypothetical protein